MKKNVLLVLCLVFLTQLAFSAKTKTIGVLFDDSLSVRWSVEKYYIKKVIRENGGNCEFRYCDGNADIQVKQAYELIDKYKVNTLIIVANNEMKMSAIVNYAHKKGIITIAYDRLINHCKLDYYVSFDNVEVGQMMAEEALRIVPNGKYILIEGPEKDNNSLLLKEGFHKALDNAVKENQIKIVLEKHMKEWINVESFSTILDFISEDENKVDAIICSNDNLALGAIEAIDLMRPGTKVFITGQDAEIDALKRIKEGSQSITIYKPIKSLARIAGELAMDITSDKNLIPKRDLKAINNGNCEVQSLLLHSILVTQDNVDKVMEEMIKYEMY